MKDLKFKELIAYASAFASFVIPKIDEINEIILFGSIARGEADEKSDIDLFFNIEKKENVEKIKKAINEELKKFYKSKIAETWLLRGIKNPININVGKLDEWKLKRSIISDGIGLYGKYKEVPQNMAGFVFFNIATIKNIAKRNKIIRELFGRNEKEYSKTGIVSEFNGKKISPSSFVVPKDKANLIIKFLGKEKVNYSFFELWTDELSL